MNNYSLTYGYFEGCGNCMFNLLRSFSSSLRDIVQASLALCPLRSSVLQKYVVNNLVMWKNRVNTHTHTHTFSPRVFYKIFSEYQNISKPREEEISYLFFRGAAMFRRSQRVSKSVFCDFAAFFLRFISSQWCSAPPCGGPRSIVSYYGVTSRHSPCLVGNAVFSFQLLTLKTKMIAEGKKRYELE